jgi:hypothetical protein
MSDKSPRKGNAKKKKTTTLKEKRTAKRTKREGPGSSIPPTGH